MLTFLGLLAGIILADLILSGDNAVVIALVCRGLPPPQRTAGMALGTAGAIILRIIMSAFATFLVGVPGLRLLGGGYLVYIAAQLLTEEEGGGEVREARSLLEAFWMVALADATMSLDNVMALAALAHGNLVLMCLGVVLSIPLVVVGARVIAAVLDRLPVLVWAGAGLLGWVAGGLVATDPALLRELGPDPVLRDWTWWVLSAAGVAVVLMVGYVATDTRDPALLP